MLYTTHLIIIRLGHMATNALAQSATQLSVLADEFIFERVPLPQCHASAIEPTPAGLIAAWLGGTHETHEDAWTSRAESGILDFNS